MYKLRISSSKQLVADELFSEQQLKTMVLSMERWSGKVAVITGASSGIGAALVEQLVENGLKVVGLARRVELIEKHAKQLENKKGKLYAVKADISIEEDIIKAFEWTTKNVGPVHILVNNAGVSATDSILKSDTEKWRKVLDVNVIGLSIATREVVKIMRAHEIDGHIIHINSILGHDVINMPDINMYPASKYAVTALTETHRQELIRIESKIKVTSISPGLVATEMTTFSETLPSELMNMFKTMPILKAEDIADSIIYALSTPPHVQIHEITIKPVGEIF